MDDALHRGLQALLSHPQVAHFGLTASQMNRPESALQGERGVVPNPQNVPVHEFSTTELIPETGPQPIGPVYANMPTMVQGQKNVQDMVQNETLSPEQRDIAVNRAMERYMSGQHLPMYSNPQTADTDAYFREMLFRSPLMQYLMQGQEVHPFGKQMTPGGTMEVK